MTQFTTTLAQLAALTTELAGAPSVDALTETLSGSLRAQLPFDELIADLTSFELNRPALVRLGVDAAWSRRYNTEFFALNPATSALRAALARGAPLARRFEDFVAEPLASTRFFREYMQPQGHAHSLVAAMPLAAVVGVAPALIVLLVRKTGRAAFT